MNRKLLTGIIALIILAAIGVSRCHGQAKDISECQCKNEKVKTYDGYAEINFTQKSINVVENSYGILYYFDKCSKVKNVRYFEINQPSYFGFIIINNHYVIVELFTYKGLNRKIYSIIK